MNDSQTTPRALRWGEALGLAANLSVWLVLWVCASRGSFLPEVVEGDAPLDQFSAARAQATLRRLLPEPIPHPLGSQAATDLHLRLVSELEALGGQVEVQTTWVAGDNQEFGRVRNVVAHFPAAEGELRTQPEANPARALLALAHYDSVEAGPGEHDDLAGVVAWLEALRAFRASHAEGAAFGTYVLFTEGEELGLLGAKAFAREHPAVDSIGLVVNLEARGTRGPSRLFQTSLGNRPWIEAYASNTDFPAAASLGIEVYRRMPNDTDLSVFLQLGLPGLNFAYIGDWAAYHTPLDRLDRGDLRSLQHHGTNVLAVLLGLQQHPELLTPTKTQRASDLVHVDLLGRWLLRYPPNVQWGVALAAWVLAMTTWLRFLPDRRAAVRFGSAFLLWPILLAMPAVIGFGVVLGLQRMTGQNLLFWSRFLPGACVGLGAWWVAWTLLVPSARKLGESAWCLATVAWYALLGLVLAYGLPGAGYLLVGSALTLGLLVHGLPERLWRGALVWGMLVPWIVWVPMHAGLLDAYGFSRPEVLLLPVVLPAMGLLPALFAFGRSTWWGFFTSGILALGFVALVATMREPYTVLRPATFNVLAKQDYGQEVVQVRVESRPFLRPKALRNKKALAIPIGLEAAGGPDWQWLGRDGNSHVDFHLSSTRGATTFSIALGKLWGQALEIEGQRLELASPEFTLYGVPQGGITGRLWIQGAPAPTLRVSDRLSGLPKALEPWVLGFGDGWIPRRRGHVWQVDRTVDLPPDWVE